MLAASYGDKTRVLLNLQQCPPDGLKNKDASVPTVSAAECETPWRRVLRPLPRDASRFGISLHLSVNGWRASPRPHRKTLSLELISINIQRRCRFLRSAGWDRPINCIRLSSIMRGHHSHRSRHCEVTFRRTNVTAGAMLIHWWCHLLPGGSII